MPLSLLPLPLLLPLPKLLLLFRLGADEPVELATINAGSSAGCVGAGRIVMLKISDIFHAEKCAGFDSRVSNNAARKADAESGTDIPANVNTGVTEAIVT